jgi:hypothetical protein
MPVIRLVHEGATQRLQFEPPRIVATPNAWRVACFSVGAKASLRGAGGLCRMLGEGPVSCPAVHTRHCSRPCWNTSRGRSRPMKTILVFFFSPGAHFGPTSLPINWCTPWKMTLRSVPFMNSTPL